MSFKRPIFFVLGIFVVRVVIAQGAWADMGPPMSFMTQKTEYAGGEAVFNGYTLKQFGDFVHNWHFVTVRFRRDSGEMRFAYANDIAWKALSEHSTDYPDGAVFAKIGVSTMEDPAFTDSGRAAPCYPSADYGTRPCQT